MIHTSLHKILRKLIPVNIEGNTYYIRITEEEEDLDDDSLCGNVESKGVFTQNDNPLVPC